MVSRPNCIGRGRIFISKTRVPYYHYWYCVFLVITMVFENGECLTSCSETAVSKVKFYNDRKNSGGFLRINRSSVLADGDQNAYLYQISASNGSFYLYDPKAKRLICWHKSFKMPIGRRFKKSESLHLCAFRDTVSKISPSSHIELVHHTNSSAILRFTSKGRFPKATSVQICGKGVRLKRRKKRCASSEFLPKRQCDSFKEISYLCTTELRNMRELWKVCRHHRHT